jgi:PAS domain S-box-containing protein
VSGIEHTDLRREGAAQVSAEQLRFLANAVPALLAYVDRDARYVWCNDSYRRWFGRAPDEIRGRHVSEVLGAAAWEGIRPHIERVLGGDEVTFDQRISYQDGRVRDVRASYVPHVDAHGRVLGFVGLVHDLSEARAAERALRRSEGLLERSQSIAHMGSWESVFAGAEGGPSLCWSDEAFRIFGFEPGAFAPTTEQFFAMVHPLDRYALRAQAAAAIAAGEPFEKEYRIIRPDGAERIVHAWISFERDADGRVARMLGTCQDITERKRAEDVLREADRRKDEFLAMLSHELRNPLAPMLSAVEILEETPPGQEEVAARSRTIIARQVRHMKRLLDDLLDVSRVSQGKIELRREPVQLVPLLQQAVEVSRPALLERRQSLTLDLGNVPLPLDADPTRIVQVFANLLNNAAKYTNEGGHVWLSVAAEGGQAVARVRDDGVGMSAEFLSQAFELFAQERRSLDRAQGGLGIGLTMARTLVRLHGGAVHVSSAGPGRGTEVVVRLPLAVQARTYTPRVPIKAAPSVGDAPLRVLVVDDNADATQTIGDILKRLGHTVTLAYDGPSALEMAAEARPDLMFLDIGLPGLDGYALAARLRAAGHRGAIVAITGYGHVDDRRRSEAAGFDHHLVKPIDFAELVRIAGEVRGRLGR